MADNAAISNALNLLSLSLQSAASTLTLLQGILTQQPTQKQLQHAQQQQPSRQQQQQHKRSFETGHHSGSKDNNQYNAKKFRPDRLPSEQTVQVKRIPASMTDDDLRGHFACLGQDAIQSLHRPYKDRTICFVGFKTPDLASQALGLTPPEKDGQKVTVEKREQSVQCTKIPEQEIILANIPMDMDNIHIKEHYSSLGSDAVVGVNRPKGNKMCFVTFKSAELAMQAANMAPPKKTTVRAVMKMKQ